MRALLNQCLVFLLISFTSFLSHAVQVTIDPAASFTYRVDGAGNYTGIRTIDLAANATHDISIRHSSVNITFNIDSAGVITSSSPWLSIIGNTITMNTVPIVFDPNGYQGSYIVGSRNRRNVETVYLIPEEGSDYTVYIARLNENNGFHFSFDANGNVTSNSTRFTTTGNNVVFNTSAVNIDTNGFGQPLIDEQYNIAQWAYRGSATAYLVPAGTGSDDFGSRYRVYIHGNTTNGFFFYLDSNGNVISDSTRITISGGSNITFVTLPVNIDIQNFDVYTVFMQVKLPYNSIATANIVPSGTGSDDFGGYYRVMLGADYSYNGFLFYMDPNGVVSLDSTRITTDGANTLVFDKSTAITIDPTSFTSTYRAGGYFYNGIVNLNVLPSGYGADDYGNSYALRVGNTDRATYTVDDPCAILPSPDVSVGAVDFHISCPNVFVDTDDDGVADSSDNCPLIANSDQIDLDNDGLGDVCDSDLDGDTIENTADNCPSIINANQLDTDGDGIGDACDEDIDGDNVNDDVDNCPLISNSDQANSDSDSLGDACDDDDDNDSILDGADNCPVSPNTDQTDEDGDGFGDACDSDVDNDGISNDYDACPGTPLNSVVSEQGCNGYQYVELNCVLENFPNHGKYVSCVTKAVNNAVSLGLLNNQDKGKIISQAAKNK